MSAQHNVEFIAKGKIRLGQIKCKLGNHQLPTLLRHPEVNWVVLQEGITREIHLGNQAIRDVAPKQGEVNVIGPPGIGVVAPGISAGLNGVKLVVAFVVGQTTATAQKIGVDGSSMLVYLVDVTPGSVGLPNLYE